MIRGGLRLRSCRGITKPALALVAKSLLAWFCQVQAVAPHGTVGISKDLLSMRILIFTLGT